MGIFGTRKIQKLESQIKALQSRNIVAAEINRNIAIYPDWKISENARRYVSTDDIYSIVGFLARTAAMVPLYAYEIKDDKAAKKLKDIQQPHKIPLQTKALQLKAYQDLTESDPLYSLLENPSENFSKFEFFEAVYTHLFGGGEVFVYKQRPDTGVNTGKPVNMILLHPDHVILKISETLPRRVVAYDYRINGQVIYENIPVEDIIHVKYYNPKITFYGDELRGLSPIHVLSKRLTQLDSNTDVQTAQMQNGGVETIVYDETSIADEGTKTVIDSRKDNFYRFLKNPSNAGAPFFASGKMGSIQLGSTLADLKVIESAQVTFKKFCNAYGVSDVLFNNDTASAYNNVEQQIKRAYTNSILPNIFRVRDALIKGLTPEFSDKKRTIREDISEVSELQPNSKDMAEWLNIAWWIKGNEKREMMRFEKDDDPLMNQYLIPAGLQTLDELNQIPDIPVVTPNGL